MSVSLPIRAQGRHPGFPGAVPRALQPTHPALGTAPGQQCPSVPERRTGRGLADRTGLSALGPVALTPGRQAPERTATTLTPEPQVRGR